MAFAPARPDDAIVRAHILAESPDGVAAAPVPVFRPGWRGSRQLWHGAFGALVVGQALGQFGDGLAQIAFAQLVVFDVGKGATPGRIAGVLAVTLLPFSVVGPLAGVLIDRWDRRRTLVVASLCRALLALVAIAAAVSRSQTIAYVGVVLLLSSSRFVLDGKGAVLPRTVSREELVRANAISSLIGMVAAFVGAVGGSTFVSWSASAGFVGAAGAYVASTGFFARLPAVGGGQPSTAITTDLRRLGSELHAGAEEIMRMRELRRPLAAVSLHRLLLGGGFVLLVLVADRRYNLSTSGYGLGIAVTGVAAFAGTMTAPLLSGRWRAAALLPLAFLFPATAAVVAGYAPTMVGLVAALAVAAVSFQSLKVLVDALIGSAAPDAVRGRVFAIYDVLYNLAFVVAGLVMLPLWRLGRERPLLWWLAAAFGVCWLIAARTASTWPFIVRAPALRAEPSNGWLVRVGSMFAGALGVVVFPKPTLWWAAWFVLVPWMVVVRRAPSARCAAERGWWAAFGFLLAVHYWLLASLTVFLPIAAALLALLWTPWAALLWHFASGRLTTWRVLAAVPVVSAGWVLIEAVRSWSALGGPWGLLGASQWYTPIFLAPAALGGVWLVTFLVVAVNVAVMVCIESSGLQVRSVAGFTVLALVAVGPASYAFEKPPQPTSRLAVAVVQAGVVHSAQQRLDDEIAATAALPAGRFALVIWGESSVGFDLFARTDVQRRLAVLSSNVGADLLVNVDATAPDGAIRKTAVLLGPSGIISVYQKMRLVPFGEYIPLRFVLGWLPSITKAAGTNRVRGHALVVMSTNAVTFAPLICFESAFPDMSRAAARAGAQLLVFQSATTTFQGTWAPDQHASLAVVRAVETGRPSVQATLAGTTAAFDAQGRRELWWPAEHGTAIVDLNLSTRTTVYDRFGDWVLAWCFVVLAAAVTANSLVGARVSIPEVPRARAAVSG